METIIVARGMVAYTREAVEVAEGAGACVRRLFPTQAFLNLDLFVLMDEFFVEPSAGFPEHRHRGFEFIIYMLEGAFRHRDSMGNEKVVPTGGIQKAMTGRGIVHSEMPAAAGANRGLQLWINLPRHLKESAPDYQYLEPSALPYRKDDGANIRIIAGEGSPVKLHTPILYIDVDIEIYGTFRREIPESFNAFVYVLDGALEVDGVAITLHKAAVLHQGSLVVSSKGNARFVLIAGKPIVEPIRLRGSYVE